MADSSDHNRQICLHAKLRVLRLFVPFLAPPRRFLYGAKGAEAAAPSVRSTLDILRYLFQLEGEQTMQVCGVGRRMGWFRCMDVYRMSGRHCKAENLCSLLRCLAAWLL